MVEVFTTNVECKDQSDLLVMELRAHFPDSRINFDLEDCDRILRVEAASVLPVKIVDILNANGYRCRILE